MKNHQTNALLDQPSLTDIKRLFQSTSDIIFELDSEGHCLAIYGKWLTELHLDDSFFIGKTVWDLFESEINTLHHQSFHRAMKGEAVTYQWNYTINQQAYCFETVLSSVHENNGIIGITREITEIQSADDRKKSPLKLSKHQAMETSLQNTYALLSYVIQNDICSIVVFDTHMNYLFVSDQFKKLYHVENQDLIGKHHYDMFPDIPKRWHEIHQRALSGETLSCEEDVHIRNNGSVEITKWDCRPWYQADGSIGGIILYSEVINKRIELVKELEETQELLRAVMKHVPIGIAVIDFSDDIINIMYMNDLFPKIYRTTKDALQQKGHFFDAIYENPIQRETMRNRIVSGVLSGDNKKMCWESIPIERSGEIIAYVSAYSSIIPNTEQLVTTVIDVTEQQRKQNQIEHMSYHDYLTDLYNRRYFVNTLDSIQDYPIGIMMMDVNGLKLINDAYGHEAGDDVLKKIATVMRECITSDDIPCRIGGDEFALIIPHAEQDRVDAIKDLLKTKIQELRIHHVSLSIAIGYEIQTRSEASTKETIKIAENIMYKRKLVEGRSMRNHAIQGILKTLTDKYIDEKTHSERVSQICQEIGLAMALNNDDIQELKMAGLLHDIGKISIPDAILDKPSALTNEEYAIIKTHPEISYQILRAADEYSDLATYALSHHERYDGKGYPKGLKGNKIPLFSRIIAVADAYEAMTANRPYRKALSAEFAQSELAKNANTQFDGSIVDVFLKILKEHPNL